MMALFFPDFDGSGVTLAGATGTPDLNRKRLSKFKKIPNS
jgi:hypothetical protein